MKKLYVVVLVALIFTAPAFASGTGENAQGNAESSRYVIGFAAKSFQDPFTSWQAQTVVRLAEESYPEFEIRLLDSEFTVATQTTIVENFVSQRVDLIIVQPLDAQALIPIIDRAYELSPPIPVINLALKIEDDHSISLESDPVLEGKLMGDYAVANLPEGANVAIIQGAPGNLVAASRQRGILESLATRPDINIVADQTSEWRRDNAMALTEDWLQVFPRIDAIICHNDDSALGAIEALKAVGKAEETMVLGVDGLPEALLSIRDGYMTGTVVQHVVNQASATLEIADDLMHDRPVSRYFQIPGELVSLDNGNVDRWIEIERDAGLID